ncbi:MAG: hypothetical protein VYC34_09445, partial [Planctomycetota bacterium]|nr:hypothetical protein [Planctomycetota bacterium]
MKAIVTDGAAASLDSRRAAPERAHGDALIRPTLCGVTALDTAAARGEGPDREFRGVLGHQCVG